jgi:hypothetical protein
METYFPTFDAARRHVLSSEEFKIQQRNMSASIKDPMRLSGVALHDYVLNRLVGRNFVRVFCGDDRTVLDGVSKLVDGIASKLKLRIAVAIGGRESEALTIEIVRRCGIPPTVIIFLSWQLPTSGPEPNQALDSDLGLRPGDASVLRMSLAPDVFCDLLERLKIFPELFVLGRQEGIEHVLPAAYSLTALNGLVLVDASDPITLEQFRNYATKVRRDLVVLDGFGLLQKQIWFSPLTLTCERSQEPLARAAKIALAAIVKNEEARVGRMIDSCSGVIDYAVVVDTGSTDRTIDIASATLARIGVPYEIIRTEFRDFSTSRNTAIDAVPPWIDWILMLDADEFLHPADHSKLAGLIIQEPVAWMLPRYNFVDAEMVLEPSPYPDRQGRLFRNFTDKRLRFFGAVHETLVGVSDWGLAPPNMISSGGDSGGPHIHHLGQINLTPEQWLEKDAFYSRLARQK